MCYAYKPVRLPSGKLSMKTDAEVRRLLREGLIKESPNGFYYPKANVEVITAGYQVKPMRWDLIPADYLRRYHLSLEEVKKKKASKAINPETGKRWGFDTYNARLETVPTTYSFKPAWKKGQRCVMPVEAWRERPNMDGAPKEFTGREFEVQLLNPEPHFLAGLYDTWTSPSGDRLDSCTVITGPSDEIPVLQGIYHERTPIVLTEAAAESWLDPDLTPDAAYSLLKGITSPALAVTEVLKEPKI
jgi:putative SOS response-associated peptidase YedK